ncbi:phosphate signaling complex protein PhoU [Caldibacillus lycopersici]|uniref:Phosphate-specific transport system accessory protein PhoU n=1 Tax=Perspicuibacillus lycopersici TaxID=1325689 RepID=A0AAE3LTV5_9BACI|nr:phosphate signaling complex protein PhoU [Perspicuibacillus lycopersici]MCU9614578.1 phosphate signaling complex protein PhoU [Perspicuibacillus lycopersici]
MALRGRFEEEIKVLLSKLTDLCNFADKALNRSITALEQYDVDAALEIMDDDAKADLLYEEINDQAIILIAKQQPVATDLRKIIMTIKIATDIERIADFAENIAKSTIRLGKKPDGMMDAFIKIKKMQEISSEMLMDSLKAFIDEDIHLAKQVADKDDEVDHLYSQTIQELFQLNQQGAGNISEIIQLLFTCRSLERTADHITNIAEDVFYLVKGKHYDLNE